MIFEVIFSSIVFEFIGASARWIANYLASKVTGKERRGFDAYWEGRKGSGHVAKTKNAIYNINIGTLVFMGIILVLVYLSNRMYYN